MQEEVASLCDMKTSAAQLVQVYGSYTLYYYDFIIPVYS